MSDQIKQLRKVADDIESKWGSFFIEKVPALPLSLKELLVNWMWWLVLIGVVFLIWSLIGVLTLLFGISSFAPWSMVMGPFMWLAMLIYFGGMLIVLYFEIKALPLIKERKRLGWQYLYWGLLVSLAAEILSFNWVGAFLSALVGFYLLFQIKEYYK